MKKLISSFLVLFLSFGNVSSVYAQSSPQAETQRLTQCMESIFGDIQTHFEKRSGQPYVLTAESRVEITKNMLKVLSDEAWEKTLLLNAGGFVLIAALSTWFYYQNPKNVRMLAKESRYFKTLLVNEVKHAAEIQKLGGAFSLRQHIYNMDDILSQKTVFKWTYRLVPVAIALAAVMVLKTAKDVHAHSDFRFELSDLWTAESEASIYYILNQDTQSVNKLRKVAIKKCKKDEALSLAEKETLFTQMWLASDYNVSIESK